MFGQEHRPCTRKSVLPNDHNNHSPENRGNPPTPWEQEGVWATEGTVVNRFMKLQGPVRAEGACGLSFGGFTCPPPLPTGETKSSKPRSNGGKSVTSRTRNSSGRTLVAQTDAQTTYPMGRALNEGSGCSSCDLGKLFISLGLGFTIYKWRDWTSSSTFSGHTDPTLFLT